jgi:ABC-type amino acid transport substrate-binding protein
MKSKREKSSPRVHKQISAILVPLVLGAFAASAAAAPEYGNCEVTGQRGSVSIIPVTPGALSVRPPAAAPGWWNGDSPETMKDGYEYCLAANMAYRAGLDRVIVVPRSFAQILTGKSTGWDIALSEISITEERKKVVNFTEPYYESAQGVLVRAGTKIDSKSIKNMKLAAQQGTTTLPLIMDKIKPAEQPNVYNDAPSMYAALAARQVDAVLYDAPNTLLKAKQSGGLLEVAGIYNTSESMGGLVNKDSPNLAAFNKMIVDFKQDGTLTRLRVKYLDSILGRDPTTIPVFTP